MMRRRRRRMPDGMGDSAHLTLSPGGTQLDQLGLRYGPAMDPEVFWQQRFDQSRSAYDLIGLLRFRVCDSCRRKIDREAARINSRT